jgi:hypothetical protein
MSAFIPSLLEDFFAVIIGSFGQKTMLSLSLYFFEGNKLFHMLDVSIAKRAYFYNGESCIPSA